eukprot:scaffold23806_cov72-Skeletonema_dohrnii-CCMP3373.AAC.2
MGRKRNQGKARKAAKAKAKEEVAEEESGNDNNQTVNGLQQSLAAQLQQLELCGHGLDLSSKADANCTKFVTAFEDAFQCKADKGGDLSSCLIAAHDATKDEFAKVWNDSAKMEIVISYFLYVGAQDILEGSYDSARVFAAFARYIEQQTAVVSKQTQAVVNFPKVNEIFNPSDMHTLVKFFRKRIPCSCLNKKYDEVKSITKIGVCYNPKCSVPLGKVERSKTMYCSRCRCATYCSHGCQKAHWAQHKPDCDMNAAIKAEFDAKQQIT